MGDKKILIEEKADFLMKLAERDLRIANFEEEIKNLKH